MVVRVTSKKMTLAKLAAARARRQGFNASIKKTKKGFTVVVNRK